ncbi:MAG: hypothetical protein UU72_C0026G0010 [candidate division WWE3 bacterium GW2011_GWB1_41_6]|uniref:YgjP-like metallopeptidase domain-containing protein n=1 Tax=candidate division WWE3 bacterium GW2011_GWB1_41_6 TaxID=1619112 RepID=A0A0G0ZTA0_UNCKA|nr:MAG: hypothetical protein UU72_C0026G0010 [candidate division WWE3 bacterium GW2011_GWB1_41_6]
MGLKIFVRKKPLRTTLTQTKSSEYLQYKEIARKLVKGKAERFSNICEVEYKRISIRNQKSKWGSCSSRGNLNFNYRIVFLPDHLADYLVVHELCHLKELNHSEKYWEHVRRILPDYKKHKKELKEVSKRIKAQART